MENLDPFLAELATHAYGWPESLRFTYDTTRRLLAERVLGDLVECGVGAGVHPAVMARALQDAGETRTVHLFDSFEGVPHGGPNDTEWNQHWGDGSGRLERTGVAACGKCVVRANLARWVPGYTCFRFHAGWFQHTLPRLGNLRSIAFLRLDGDLYESTLVCLQHLYPLVSSGGVLVVDDWNLDGCRQAVSDYFGAEWAGHPFAQPTVITESGDVWWTKP